jgi:hypothetical protein
MRYQLALLKPAGRATAGGFKQDSFDGDNFDGQ